MTIVASGVTERNAVQNLVQPLEFGGVYTLGFYNLPGEVPPWFYFGDVIQVLIGFPFSNAETQIYHQDVWWISTVLDVKQSFETVPQALFVKWKLSGASWELDYSPLP